MKKKGSEGQVSFRIFLSLFLDEGCEPMGRLVVSDSTNKWVACACKMLNKRLTFYSYRRLYTMEFEAGQWTRRDEETGMSDGKMLIRKQVKPLR